jgi:hypothetical protein
MRVDWGLRRSPVPTHRRDLVEVYAPEHSDIRMIPDEADFVVAFVVDDVRECWPRYRPPVSNSSTSRSGRRRLFGDPELGEFAWFCVRAPDGRSYVIEQVPD